MVPFESIRIMRKLLLLFLSIICITMFAYDPFSAEDAPHTNDSCFVGLYKHYLCDLGYPGGHSLTFMPNYSFYCGDSLGGAWRITNDTLLLYENYRDTALTMEDVEELTPPEWPLELKYELYPEHRRVVFMGLPYSEYLIKWIDKYPYAGNVSAFKIYNYGDSLISVFCDTTDITNMASNTFIHTSETHYRNRPPIFFGCRVGNYSDEEMKQVMYRPWHNVKIDWQEGDFVVGEKIEQGGEVLHVNLVRDSITYHIVDPRYYLKGSSVRLYDKRDEKALSEWMKRVESGKTYKFRLQRPNYPKDSIANFPRLNTPADSLCIGESEAYGYFFARQLQN